MSRAQSIQAALAFTILLLVSMYGRASGEIKDSGLEGTCDPHGPGWFRTYGEDTRGDGRLYRGASATAADSAGAYRIAMHRAQQGLAGTIRMSMRSVVSTYLENWSLEPQRETDAAFADSIIAQMDQLLPATVSIWKSADCLGMDSRGSIQHRAYVVVSVEPSPVIRSIWSVVKGRLAMPVRADAISDSDEFEQTVREALGVGRRVSGRRVDDSARLGPGLAPEGNGPFNDQRAPRETTDESPPVAKVGELVHSWLDELGGRPLLLKNETDRKRVDGTVHSILNPKRTADSKSWIVDIYTSESAKAGSQLQPAFSIKYNDDGQITAISAPFAADKRTVSLQCFEYTRPWFGNEPTGAKIDGNDLLLPATWVIKNVIERSGEGNAPDNGNPYLRKYSRDGILLVEINQRTREMTKNAIQDGRITGSVTSPVRVNEVGLYDVDRARVTGSARAVGEISHNGTSVFVFELESNSNGLLEHKIQLMDKHGALVAVVTSWKGNDKPEVALDATNEVLVAGKGNVYRFDNGAAVIAQLKSKTASAATELVGPIELLPVAADDAGVTAQKVGIAETAPHRHFDSSGAAFVWIPAGNFLMGSPTSEENRGSDESQHRVEITQGFYLSATEVTQAQYELVMDVDHSEHKGVGRPAEIVSWQAAVRFCNRLSAREGLLPVYWIAGNSVTWSAKANGYRLPTEAEWEYACRAGATTAYHTGDSGADLLGVGWYSGNTGSSETRPVGAMPPNAWGLYDMHGNVSEWCWDWVGEYGSGTQKDPRGPADGSDRVYRGGNWFHGAGSCRSANRDAGNPSHASALTGFRVVRSSVP